VGFVRAGTAVNVVPEHAETFVDIRSLDDETARRLVETVTRTIADSAASGGCGAEIEVESAYGAYRVPPDSRAVRLAAVAFERVGRTIEPFETRGGSDANVLRARGLDCVNLAHAVVDLHGPDEHVAVADLALMKRVVLEIVAAACSTPDTPDG
jgi:di/tripeptidase